jgi:hypothetical protein
MKISPFHQIHPQQIAGFVINDGNTNQGHGGAKQHRGYGAQEAGCNAGFEGTEFVATADKDAVDGIDPAAHLIGWQDLQDSLPYNYTDTIKGTGEEEGKDTEIKMGRNRKNEGGKSKAKDGHDHVSPGVAGRWIVGGAKHGQHSTHSGSGAQDTQPFGAYQ